MGSATIILMVITIFSKLTGLLREMFTSAYLGTSALADVYSTAANIPYTIFGFILAGVGTSFIPIYNKIKHEKGVKYADRYTSNLANILVIVSVLVIGLIYLLAPFMVKLFAAGYSPNKAKLTVQFTRIISLATLTSVVSSVYIAYLNLKGSFTVPALTGVFMNVFHIITFVVAYKLNNFFIIAYGYVLADIFKYALFPRTLRKNNYKHRFIMDLSDPNIKLMIKMSIPIILSIASVDLGTIVDQSLASLIDKGSHGAVSSLRYSILILQLISGVIVVSIATAMYPKISAYAAENKNKLLKKTLMQNVIFGQLLVIPSMVGLMVLAKPTVSLILERVNFDAESTSITAMALFYYLPSLFGSTITDLMVRGFFAQRNIMTPVWVSVIQQSVNVMLSIILSEFMGIAGLALATSISSFVGAVVVIYLFRKKYGKISLKGFMVSNIKIIIASLIMGIFTNLTYNLLSGHGRLIPFVLSILVSIVVYGIIILFMRIPEVRRTLFHLLKKRKKRTGGTTK